MHRDQQNIKDRLASPSLVYAVRPATASAWCPQSSYLTPTIGLSQSNIQLAWSTLEGQGASETFLRHVTTAHESRSHPSQLGQQPRYPSPWQLKPALQICYATIQAANNFGRIISSSTDGGLDGVFICDIARNRETFAGPRMVSCA
jgi:hypothetical protein